MTKLSGLSTWRMELSVIQTEKSKEQVWDWSRSSPGGMFEILSNNQRRHQVGSCIYDSRIQGRIRGEDTNVRVTGTRVRLQRVQLYTQKKLQRSGGTIMKMLDDKEKLTKRLGSRGYRGWRKSRQIHILEAKERQFQEDSHPVHQILLIGDLT